MSSTRQGNGLPCFAATAKWHKKETSQAPRLSAYASHQDQIHTTVQHNTRRTAYMDGSSKEQDGEHEAVSSLSSIVTNLGTEKKKKLPRTPNGYRKGLQTKKHRSNHHKTTITLAHQRQRADALNPEKTAGEHGRHRRKGTDQKQGSKIVDPPGVASRSICSACLCALAYSERAQEKRIRSLDLQFPPASGLELC